MGFKRRSEPPVRHLAARLVAALAGGANADVAPLLDRQVSLGLWRWDGAERHQGREAAARRLREEAESWPDVEVEQSRLVVEGARAVVELRIVVDSPRGPLAHHRCAVLAAGHGGIEQLDIYCAEPIPESPADDAALPPGLSHDALDRALTSQRRRFRPSSVRDGMSRYHSVRCRRSTLADPDPLSNTIHGACWSDDEADRAIDELVSWHRSRGRGISWRVNPDDRPTDLGERLVRRGFQHLADEESMILRLDDRTGPTRRSDVEIQTITGADGDENRIALDIVARAFEWSPATTASVGRSWDDRMQPTPYWQRVHYLARVDGIPVGFATMSLRSGLAMLTGAATLPAYQHRGIYTSLLAQRLDDASARGYHYATIEARPGSRAIAARYGFQTRARVAVYVLAHDAPLPSPPVERVPSA